MAKGMSIPGAWVRLDAVDAVSEPEIARRMGGSSEDLYSFIVYIRDAVTTLEVRGDESLVKKVHKSLIEKLEA